MANRKFLIPVAAAVTALTGVPSNAALPTQTEITSAKPIDLGGLVIDNATPPVVRTAHASHASHGSHISHASHASASS